MYLALLPDADSLAALKHFAPSLPRDAHVTVIHSKASPEARAYGIAPMPLPKWAGSLVLDTGPVTIFGGRRQVFGLKLVLCDELQSIRTQAERILHEAGLRWSREWPFAPHIALLGSTRASLTPPPATLRFDRMEWR